MPVIDNKATVAIVENTANVLKCNIDQINERIDVLRLEQTLPRLEMRLKRNYVFIKGDIIHQKDSIVIETEQYFSESMDKHYKTWDDVSEFLISPEIKDFNTDKSWKIIGKCGKRKLKHKLKHKYKTVYREVNDDLDLYVRTEYSQPLDLCDMYGQFKTVISTWANQTSFVRWVCQQVIDRTKITTKEVNADDKL